MRRHGDAALYLSQLADDLLTKTSAQFEIRQEFSEVFFKMIAAVQAKLATSAQSDDIHSKQIKKI